MGSKDSQRARLRRRTRTIERLEDRQVMSADPIGGLLGGSIEHHAFEDAPPLVHHGVQDAPPLMHHDLQDAPPLMHHGVQDAPPIEHHDLQYAPPLAHHATPDADFWLDPWSERDADTLSGDIHQTLSSAHNSSGLTGVRNDYGFTGGGQTVAIIDSGIAWNHTALGGGLGANYRVVGGWDFAEGDADPYDDGPEGSHGTHVAGIVGSNATGTNNDGVATGVDLVGLRVFDDAGNGFFSWVEQALQWVHQNRNSFENPITAVNLSLGTSWNADTIPPWTTMEDEFAQLEADGIFVAVSAGNSFTSYNAPGLSYPAASPHVVPVMSVTDAGSLSGFSQRHTRAIGAPGNFIVSTVPDYAGNNNGTTDDFASFSGTSMAAPYVAGASVLLREAMQFVGYTNITQDTIYDHMMATATSFFDSATQQTYKRLNLTNAFNALMPTDEYGSTIATAHNLGTLSGESELSGLIGKLSDSDYFSFTAAANGTVSFTATTTHGLATVWNATGGTVSGTQGETYTFDVTAGQSYTIGLSTSGGIGYYDLAIAAESEFTYTDWGTVTQSQHNNVGISNESWYRVTTNQAGYLTAEALFASAGGNVDVALYDSNLQLVANGVANAAGERVEFVATAGTNYFLRVTGSNADVDFRLTNLVSNTGATVTVNGTSNSDEFTFTVGTNSHKVVINGASYQFSKASVITISFAGDSGTDAITMTGSTGKETATLRAGTAQLIGGGFTVVTTSIENATVHGGGGGDVAHLYDSLGDDSLETWWNRARMTGSGYSNDARSFTSTYSYSSQGTDRATLRDSAGDDTYSTWTNRALMCGTNFWNEARGFDNTVGIASQGYDNAMLRDSTGDDLFTSYAARSIMSGTGYSHDARSFDRVFGVASQGNDLAKLYDTSGDDVYSAWWNRAAMSGSGYWNEARNFDQTLANASTGNDLAYFYDTAGDDTYTSWWNRAMMSGNGYCNDVRNFDRTTAVATTGNDRAVLRDSSTYDEVHASGTNAYIMGANFCNEVDGFDRVDAYDTDGDGSDATFVGAVDYLFNLFGNWS
jgi:subtilisin family serine protease